MDETDKEVHVEKKQKAVENQVQVAEAPARTPLPKWLPWALAGLAALLIAVGAYSAGYHMARKSVTVDTRNGMGTARGETFNNDRGMMSGSTGNRGRGMMSGSTGEVTAVSADSITIKDTMRGGSVTYKIDSTTKVTQSGTTKAVSDIKTGDTVRIAATGTDTTIATEIVLGTN